MNLQRTLAAAFVAVALFACGQHKPYSTRFNLDFEYLLGDSVPARWESPFSGFNGYTATSSRSLAHSGQASLRLERIDSTKSTHTDFRLHLTPEMVAGREVTLSGWIRTSGVNDGHADLFIEQIGSDFTPATPRRGVRATTGWTHVSTTCKIDEHTPGVEIGGILKGGGSAWFDDLKLIIDGRELRDTLIPAPKSRLSRADKKELRKYIYPLQTCDPTAADTSDLTVLRKLVGTSTVVGLGENTHGSGETFRLKHRLIRYLAANRGFDIFAIEGDMAGSYFLNEYIRQGRGSLNDLMWKTYWPFAEVADLMLWMRHHNRTTPRIAFTGFDMQWYEHCMSMLRQGLNDDPQSMALLTPLEPLFAQAITYDTSAQEIRPDSTTINSLRGPLERLDERIETTVRDTVQRHWLHQNVTLLRQYLEQEHSYRWRDRCMARNLLWTKQQNPASKIIVWAHNGHIQKGNGLMGGLLKESLGTDYVNFGFTFHQGRYAGVSELSLPAQRAYPGTLEYLLGQLDEPLFILDLKRIREDRSPVMEWFDDLEFRHLGVIRFSNEFWETGVMDKFDYLIFIRESSAAKLFMSK